MELQQRPLSPREWPNKGPAKDQVNKCPRPPEEEATGYTKQAAQEEGTAGNVKQAAQQKAGATGSVKQAVHQEA